MSAPERYDAIVIGPGHAGAPWPPPWHGAAGEGDVKGGPAISHDDLRVFRTNLLQGGSACVTDWLLPYAVFIDPRLGRIVLSERAARRQGRAEPDDSRSFIQTLVDPAPAPSWAPPSSESRAAR
jgi:hypothetical protein